MTNKLKPRAVEGLHTGAVPRAFTLLELIGVLAILSILASMLVPSVIEQIDRAYMQKEQKELKVIGEELRRRILQDKTIPGGAWATFIAEEFEVPAARVSQTASDFYRAYLVDPAILIEGALPTFPYTQPEEGIASLPENVRILMVSSHRQALPDFVVSGAVDEDSFNRIWDLQTGSVPSDWPSEWSGKGERINVFRLDLTGAFRRLTINNFPSGATPSVSIGGADPFYLTDTVFSAYFFETVSVDFYTNDVHLFSDFLKEDKVYHFEQGVWRSRKFEGKGDQSAFALALDAFLLANENSAATGGVVKQDVVDAYEKFAIAYALWTKAGFPGSGTDEYSLVTSAASDFVLTTRSLTGQ